MGKVAEAAGQQRLLDIAGDVEFLLEALALAFALDQARVVQNAGGFDGQGIEDLAIEFGKGGGAARIEVENAEKMAALDVHDGFLGIRARHGVERNGHDGAKRLRDDALRALERDVGLAEVLGDDAGFPVHGQTQGGLRGSDALRGHAHASSAASQAMAKRSGGIGLEQKAAVGVGDGNGAVHHGVEHGVQREAGNAAAWWLREAD